MNWMGRHAVLYSELGKSNSNKYWVSMPASSSVQRSWVEPKAGSNNNVFMLYIDYYFGIK